MDCLCLACAQVPPLWYTFRTYFTPSGFRVMVGQLANQHIRKQLKKIHAISIALMVVFFVLLVALSIQTDVDTTVSQIIVLGMGVTLAVGYLTLLPDSEKEPHIPLILFFVLNVLTSALVWSTGLLFSPFIILYVVLTIVTTQLYHYWYGLAQIILAVLGFIFVYGATTNGLLELHSLLPNTPIDLFYQPSEIILTYGGLYAVLLLFTALSSSSARTLLFRPHKATVDSTYQEKIIADMPIGVLIVDNDLNILGSNPAAEITFPFGEAPAFLGDYLSLPKVRPTKTLLALSKSGEEKHLTWNLDSGEVTPVTITVRTIGQKAKNRNFIIFLEQ